MTDSLYSQFQYAKERDTVTLYGSFTVGAAGAVGTVKGGGISGVTKVAATTGQYDVAFTDSFARYLHSEFGVVLGSLSVVANIQVFQAPATLQADVLTAKAVRIACVDYAGAAVEPDNGSQVMFKLVLRRTSYGPFD